MNRPATRIFWIDLRCEKCGLRVRLSRSDVRVTVGPDPETGARVNIHGEPAKCPGHPMGYSYWLEVYDPPVASLSTAVAPLRAESPTPGGHRADNRSH